MLTHNCLWALERQCRRLGQEDPYGWKAMPHKWLYSREKDSENFPSAYSAHTFPNRTVRWYFTGSPSLVLYGSSSRFPILSSASLWFTAMVARSLLATGTGWGVLTGNNRVVHKVTCPCHCLYNTSDALVFWQKLCGKFSFCHRDFAQIPEHCLDMLDMMMSLLNHEDSNIDTSLHAGSPSFGGKSLLLITWLVAERWGKAAGNPHLHQEVWLFTANFL